MVRYIIIRQKDWPAAPACGLHQHVHLASGIPYALKGNGHVDPVGQGDSCQLVLDNHLLWWQALTDLGYLFQLVSVPIGPEHIIGSNLCVAGYVCDLPASSRILIGIQIDEGGAVVAQEIALIIDGEKKGLIAGADVEADKFVVIHTKGTDGIIRRVIKVDRRGLAGLSWKGRIGFEIPGPAIRDAVNGSRQDVSSIEVCDGQGTTTVTVAQVTQGNPADDSVTGKSHEEVI